MTGCHYCGTDDDLRPYGPGGSLVCFPCMKATPEREAAAHGALGALMDAAEAISPTGVIAIGEACGETVDLQACREAEIRAGLDWNLTNAHSLLMLIGPLIDECERLRLRISGLAGRTE